MHLVEPDDPAAHPPLRVMVNGRDVAVLDGRQVALADGDVRARAHTHRRRLTATDASQDGCR